MNQVKSILTAAIIGTSLTSLQAFAVTGSASFNINATVIAAVSILKNNDLSFGSIAVGTTSLVVAASASPANGTAAKFTLSGGNAGQSVNLSLASATTTLNSGANTITVDTFKFDTSGAATQTVTMPGGAGTVIAYLGATATLSPTQATGSYTGSNTFNITYT